MSKGINQLPIVTEISAEQLPKGGGTVGVGSVSNADGTLTISPTVGNVVASLNLAHANTWTAVQAVTTATDGAQFAVTGSGANGPATITATYSGSGTGTTASSAFSVSNLTGEVGNLAGSGTSYTANGPFSAGQLVLQSYFAAGTLIGTWGTGAPLKFGAANGIGTMTEYARMSTAGKFGFASQSTPTAWVHIGAGSTAANTAPLKLTSGSLNTTAEAGAVEFLSDKFYATITTSAARKELTLNDAALTSGRVPFGTTNGRLTDADAALTWDTANGGRLGIVVGSTALVASPADRGLYVLRGTSTYTVVESSLNTGYAGLLIRNNSGDAGTYVTTGSTFSTSGMFQAANTYLVNYSANDLWIANSISGKAVRIVAGGTATTNEICRFSAAAITVADATDVVLNTTTGTKIGTATGQKLGFWNVTPVVQQVLATGAGKTVDDVITLLQTLGLCKQS